MPTNEELVTTEPMLAISTVGEIHDWINHEAVGSSAHAATYLEAMRELMDYVDEKEPDPTGQDETKVAVYTLASTIGQFSERNFQKKHVDTQGNLIDEVDGVVPVREVSDANILFAAVQFNPDHPEYKGYEGSDVIFKVHNAVEDIVAERLNKQ